MRSYVSIVATMKGDRLGEFEELALLAVRALGDGAYGVVVQDTIERTTGRDVTIGAVYSALDRMERKGLLRSSWSDAIPERGGKRRRLFELTRAGQTVLADARRAREALWNAVPKPARGRS
jgi:PadR family transcriptional regulator PadR